MGRTGTGVEVRANSIRIKFTLDGLPHAERLVMNGASMKPTPANVKYAHRLAGDVRRAIELGRFTWEEFFPESPHAASAAAEAAVAVLTLGGLADEWLQSKGRLSVASIDQYATAARFWKRLLGEATPVADLTHKVLAAAIGGFAWPSAKTHNNYMIALRGMFALEFRGEATLRNPLAGITNMKVVRKLPDPLTIEERDRILADMAERYDVRITAYFRFMFFTGMRPEEAIALRWSDLEATKRVIRVQRVRTFKGSERDGSKTHSERDVDLVPQAIDALTSMAPFTKMLRAERLGGDDTAADVFQNPVTGRAWHDERSQRDHYWRPCLKRLGIRWRRPYCCRHTYATVALMGSERSRPVPPAYIAAQLGHSLKMLLDVYARWIPANDNGNARALLEDAMGPNSSQILPNAPINAGSQGGRK